MNRKQLLFVFIIFILNFNIVLASQFDFRKTKWGMSKSQVKASEKAEFGSQNKDAMIYVSELAGMKVFIVYSFISNKLHSGSYAFQGRHTNKNNYISDFKDVKKTFDQKIWHSNFGCKVLEK